MVTSKQRAYLRRLSHDINPIIQIGKDGVTVSVEKAIDEALEKRELIKVHILESALLDTKDTCNELAEKLNADAVQAIGSKFTLYRQSSDEKNRKTELPT